MRESLRSARFLSRVVFLLLCECHYFPKKETDLPSTTAYAREFVGAGAAVVNGLLRASEDLGYFPGADSSPRLHQTHRCIAPIKRSYTSRL